MSIDKQLKYVAKVKIDHCTVHFTSGYTASKMETNHSDFQHLFRLWREGIPTCWEKLPDDVRVEKIEFIKDFMKIHVLDSIDDLAYLAQADDRSIFARCEGIQGGVMFLDRGECPNAKDSLL